MAAPFYNLRSKLDRAIVAYLQTEGVADNIYTALNSTAKDIDISTSPAVFVRSHTGRVYTENPYSGVYVYQVEVCAEGSAAAQPEDKNPEEARMQLDEVFSGTVDALMYSDANDGSPFLFTADAITAAGRALATNPNAQIAANNADMVDFTCQAWSPSDPAFDGGNPRAEGGADTTVWKEIANFQAVCCASNVS